MKDKPPTGDQSAGLEWPARGSPEWDAMEAFCNDDIPTLLPTGKKSTNNILFIAGRKLINRRFKQKNIPFRVTYRHWKGLHGHFKAKLREAANIRNSALAAERKKEERYRAARSLVVPSIPRNAFCNDNGLMQTYHRETSAAEVPNDFQHGIDQYTQATPQFEDAQYSPYSMYLNGYSRLPLSTGGYPIMTNDEYGSSNDCNLSLVTTQISQESTNMPMPFAISYQEINQGQVPQYTQQTQYIAQSQQTAQSFASHADYSESNHFDGPTEGGSTLFFPPGGSFAQGPPAYPPVFADTSSVSGSYSQVVVREPPSHTQLAASRKRKRSPDPTDVGNSSGEYCSLLSKKGRHEAINMGEHPESRGTSRPPSTQVVIIPASPQIATHAPPPPPQSSTQLKASDTSPNDAESGHTQGLLAPQARHKKATSIDISRPSVKGPGPSSSRSKSAVPVSKTVPPSPACGRTPDRYPSSQHPSSSSSGERGSTGLFLKVPTPTHAAPAPSSSRAPSRHPTPIPGSHSPLSRLCASPYPEIAISKLVRQLREVSGSSSGSSTRHQSHSSLAQTRANTPAPPPLVHPAVTQPPATVPVDVRESDVDYQAPINLSNGEGATTSSPATAATPEPLAAHVPSTQPESLTAGLPVIGEPPQIGSVPFSLPYEESPQWQTESAVDPNNLNFEGAVENAFTSDLSQLWANVASLSPDALVNYGEELMATAIGYTSQFEDGPPSAPFNFLQ